MTTDPRLLDSFNRKCECGAEVVAEKDLAASPSGQPRVRLGFECGGEVAVQLVHSHARYWKAITRHICGALDPEEEDVV
jgi:hypothetical protein